MAPVVRAGTSVSRLDGLIGRRAACGRSPRSLCHSVGPRVAWPSASRVARRLRRRPRGGAVAGLPGSPANYGVGLPRSVANGDVTGERVGPSASPLRPPGRSVRPTHHGAHSYRERIRRRSLRRKCSFDSSMGCSVGTRSPGTSGRASQCRQMCLLGGQGPRLRPKPWVWHVLRCPTIRLSVKLSVVGSMCASAGTAQSSCL